MPRPAKGARLWLRKERIDKRTGKRIANAAWFILDGGEHIPTGCAAGEIEQAEKRLKEYIAEKYRPERRERDIERIDIADVLSIYDDDTRQRQANLRTFDQRLSRLAEWWGGKMLSDVTGESCRAYVEHRRAVELQRRATAKHRPKGTPTAPTAGGARRDLEDLRAAINHHAKQGLHRGVVKVALPEKGTARDRWLTRDEAARLLWVCWRAREEQKRHRGPDTGKVLPTDKRPLRHVARFILLGLYTGSRAAALAAASPSKAIGRSYVDLDRGIFYRLAEGKKATNKRQPPVPIPPHLLAHMRRWQAKGIAGEHFVQWNGKPVISVKTAFGTAVEKAGLDGKVTPHTLRHTAATWLMQNGVPIWTAAGFLGMSPEMVERTYGHHHPDYLAEAVRGFKPKKSA
ncbi:MULTISPECIES: site-specific integrase [unclassified Chelatococcus]|uniref:tyrosine-type recombinase/integrase n=1 Tax=unclassified Chelatococcus TaxID=2638111 RepID=UPI001BCD4534|nr:MULTISPECIES: site-specific integrase [unclassified Chelatococcus]MBS7697825.1 site-specific integrase [Chelatococcus sp. YT9]MBX3559820.1 site-specific integrase [Chelatococcus sp.]